MVPEWRLNGQFKYLFFLVATVETGGIAVAYLNYPPNPYISSTFIKNYLLRLANRFVYE